MLLLNVRSNSSTTAIAQQLTRAFRDRAFCLLQRPQDTGAPGGLLQLPRGEVDTPIPPVLPLFHAQTALCTLRRHTTCTHRCRASESSQRLRCSALHWRSAVCQGRVQCCGTRRHRSRLLRGSAVLLCGGVHQRASLPHTFPLLQRFCWTMKEKQPVHSHSSSVNMCGYVLQCKCPCLCYYCLHTATRMRPLNGSSAAVLDCVSIRCYTALVTHYQYSQREMRYSWATTHRLSVDHPQRSVVARPRYDCTAKLTT
jgi:hypothetical protein